MLKRVTSGGVHLRCLAPGQHSFEETWQRWPVVGDSAYALFDPRIELKTYRADGDVFCYYTEQFFHVYLFCKSCIWKYVAMLFSQSWSAYHFVDNMLGDRTWERSLPTCGVRFFVLHSFRDFLCWVLTKVSYSSNAARLYACGIILEKCLSIILKGSVISVE